VVDYVPSTVRPFEEMRAGILAKLQREAAVKLARAAGETRLAQLRKEPDDAAFEAVHDLGRRDTGFLPPTALTSVMAEPAAKLPDYLGFDQPDGTYAIVHVLSVSHAAPASEADQAAQDKTWTDRIVNADQAGFVQALRDRFDARITRADLSTPAKAAPKSKP
jgi:peptidyl-prolyl cis-trans isomerase D